MSIYRDRVLPPNPVIAGYTTLGTGAPAIKLKKITGTTPTAGNSATYSTGITKNQVISFTCMVSDNNAAWILPTHGIQGTAVEYYFVRILSDGTLSINLPAESTGVQSCAFICLITYIE